MGECRKDESVTDAQDKIARLEMRAGIQRKGKSSEFIRVKIISPLRFLIKS